MLVRISGVFVACLALLSTSVAAASAEAPSNVGASVPVPQLSFVSDKEYFEEFGKSPSKDAELTRIPASFSIKRAKSNISASRLDPPFAWYSISFADNDNAGRDLPTRHGNNDLGYVHYSGPHNLIAIGPVRAAYRNNWPDSGASYGSHFEYQSYLTDSWGNIYVRIRVVNEQNSVSGDGRYHTPDGRPLGTITAYCEGVNRCPDEVNGF